MAQLINEAKRFQQLAGIINEAEQITPDQQKIVDDILNTLEEGMFDNMLSKVKEYAKKGLITATMLTTLLAAPNLSSAQKSSIQQAVKQEQPYIGDPSIKDAQGKALYQAAEKNITALQQFIKSHPKATWASELLQMVNPKNSSLKGRYNNSDTWNSLQQSAYRFADSNNNGDAFLKTLKESQLDIDSVVNEALDNYRLDEATTPSPTNTPVDVKNLSKAQTLATTVQNKAKAINNIQEFPGAFENWFKTLGYQPGKISKSAIRTQVEKVLTNLGYK